MTTQKKILIADDSSIMRQLLSSTLTELGHSVLEFPDGEALWKHLESAETPPDLCLLDQNMPELTGLEVCQRMRSRPELASVPILMLTAESAPDLKSRAKELGVRGWVLKPFNKESFAVVIQKVLGESKA